MLFLYSEIVFIKYNAFVQYLTPVTEFLSLSDTCLSLLTGIRKITKPCFSHILHRGDETDQQYQTR